MTEKRINCQSCGYPMRILSETEDDYDMYCANCKMDRYVEKYSLNQLLRDISREKCISEENLIELYKKQENKIKQLEFKLKECQEHKLFSRRQLEDENEQLKDDITILEIKLKRFEDIMSDFDISSFDDLRYVLELGCGV